MSKECIKNDAGGFTFPVSALQSTTTAFGYQVNPTLAAGDVKISRDGGAYANLTNLPTVKPAGGRQIEVVLTQAEINCDYFVVQFVDQAGAEWAEFVTEPIYTVARHFDDLAFPTTSGRGIDVSAGGEVGLDWANIGSPTTTVGLSGTTVGTATTLTNAPSDSSGVTTLLSRLSAARAGYLDNLSAGAVALASALTSAAADITTLLSRLTGTRAGYLDNLSGGAVATSSALAAVQADTDDIQTRLPAALTGAGNLKADAQVVSDKTGYALTSAYDPAKTAAQAGDAMALTTGERTTLAGVIWAALTSGLTTVGSIGKLLVDNIDAAISSRLATSGYTAPLDAAGTRSAVGLASANLDTQLDALPTNAELATALAGADDATLAAIAALNDLDAATVKAQADQALADASLDALVQTAGKLWVLDESGNPLPHAADVRTQADAALAAYDGPTKAELDAAVAPLALEATVAAIDVPTATENADELLTRDWTLVAAPADRSALNALRSSRNRVKVDTGTLTVYEEDDTTPAWTGAVTTAAGNPVTEVDPA